MIAHRHITTAAFRRTLAALLCALALTFLCFDATAQTTVADQSDPTADSASVETEPEQESRADDALSERREEDASQADTPEETDADDSGTVAGNVKTDSGDDYFGRSHRERMYRQSKLSSTRALLYTLALPGLGNVYAEQYFLAGLAFSLMAFTAMFVLYGVSTQQPQFVHMGLITAGVAYSGGAVSSYLGVKKYNRRLRDSFNLDDTRSARPTSPFELPRARTVDVTIRF
jgi:hypothetical protein